MLKRDPKNRNVQKEEDFCLPLQIIIESPCVRACWDHGLSHFCCTVTWPGNRREQPWREPGTRESWKKAKRRKPEHQREVDKPQGRLKKPSGRDIMNIKLCNQCGEMLSQTLGYILNKKFPPGINHEKTVLWRSRYCLSFPNVPSNAQPAHILDQMSVRKEEKPYK